MHRCQTWPIHHALAQAIGDIGRSLPATGHRPLPKYLKDEYRNRFLALSPQDEKYSDAQMEEFLQRISTGRTPKEVSKDRDMPSTSTWCDYRRENPNYESKFRKVYELLPFEVQARAQRLGARFKVELRKLFDQGMSDKEAGKALGVTAMACNRITKKWRQNGKNPARQ